MAATKAEHMRELETAIELRMKEIADLNERKQALQSQMAITSRALQDDPLLAYFPVLDYCGRHPAKSIRSIPVEQVGNIMTQFNIVLKVIAQQNQQDAAEEKSLTMRIRDQDSRCHTVTNKLQSLASETGIDIRDVSQRSRLGNAAAHDQQDAVSLDELNARKLIVTREIELGRAVRQRKGNAIVEMQKVLDARRAMIDDIDELYNNIRVADRDLTVEQEETARLAKESDDATAEFEALQGANDNVALQIIEQDVMNLKATREGIINDKLVPQERVISAQEFRLAQLQKRAHVVDEALSSNRLTRDVNKIVSRHWAEPSNAIVVSDASQDLYDIERIIPAQETIHPGLYNLLLTQKDRFSRKVSLLNIVTKEKEELIGCLSSQLVALSKECNNAIQQLDEVAAGAAVSEEERRTEALNWVQEQRNYYHELLARKQRLKAAIVS